jgi:type II secretory pathway component PulJ
MKQGRSFLPLCMALALGAAVALSTVAVAPAATKSSATTKSAKSRQAMHQFTGYVTALDKSTMTVEKRGKKPQTRVFTRHAEMKSTGDVEKDARVTVYYRDEGGRSVAHRVVVKDGTVGSAGGR